MVRPTDFPPTCALPPHLSKHRHVVQVLLRKGVPVDARRRGGGSGAEIVSVGVAIRASGRSCGSAGTDATIWSGCTVVTTGTGACLSSRRSAYSRSLNPSPFPQRRPLRVTATDPVTIASSCGRSWRATGSAQRSMFERLAAGLIASSGIDAGSSRLNPPRSRGVGTNTVQPLGRGGCAIEVGNAAVGRKWKTCRPLLLQRIPYRLSGRRLGVELRVHGPSRLVTKDMEVLGASRTPRTTGRSRHDRPRQTNKIT
jgi:hypothetical protein